MYVYVYNVYNVYITHIHFAYLSIGLFTYLYLMPKDRGGKLAWQGAWHENALMLTTLRGGAEPGNYDPRPGVLGTVLNRASHVLWERIHSRHHQRGERTQLDSFYVSTNLS